MWIALTVLLGVAAAFLFHETRGGSLWFDEWMFVLDRRGNDVATFLRPHNEHLSLVPIAIYKLLFATAGLNHTAPYRAVVIAGHLACVLLVFRYARRRVQAVPAVLAAALILLLGPAWQNFLWPFQIGSLISLGAGLGALLALDRDDPRGNGAACALVALSLASSGLGIAVAAGVVVELAWARRRLRDAWIVAAPIAVYAVWWIGYHPAGLIEHNVVLTPRFVADAAAGAVSTFAGLADASTGGAIESLAWGRPLLVAGVALLIWRCVALGALPPRALTLLAMIVAFWLLTALRRAGLGEPDASRYLYVGVLFIVLLVVELGRGVVIAPRAQLLLAAVVAVVVVANVGDLRAGARYLRAQTEPTRADLGALEIARPLVTPGYVATAFPGYPFIVIRADRYFAAARDLGSPAATAAQIAAAPEPARLVADTELTHIHQVALRPGSPGAPRGRRPTVDGVSGGAVAGHGACVSFAPTAAGPVDLVSALQLTVPRGGLALTTSGGAATVAVRRFAAGFPAEPQGRLAAAASATLRIGPDRATQPWHVQVAPQARVTACGLR